MRIVLTREGMYLVIVNNCVFYTFDIEKATDFSNMETEEFANYKKKLEEKEMCEFEIKFVRS